MTNPKILTAAFLTVLLWSTAFANNKICLQYLTPGLLGFYRYFYASVFLNLLIPIFRPKFPKTNDLPKFFLSGLFGVALYNYLLYTGQRHISAGVAGLLTNTAPLFTAIIGYVWFKNSMRWMSIIGLLISFVGIFLIMWGRSGGNLSFTGHSLFVLGAACSISIYFFVQKPLFISYSTFEVLFYTIVSSLVWLLPIAIKDMELIFEAPAKIHALVAYLGIFPGAIAYFTWAIVNRYVSPSVSAPFLFLTPIVGFVFSYFAVDEIPTNFTVVGTILTLFGVYVVLNTSDHFTKQKKI